MTKEEIESNMKLCSRFINANRDVMRSKQVEMERLQKYMINLDIQTAYFVGEKERLIKQWNLIDDNDD